MVAITLFLLGLVSTQSAIEKGQQSSHDTIVSIRTVDSIALIHVRSLLARHKFDLLYSRSVATYLHVDGDPAVIKALLDAEAPASAFCVGISTRAGSLREMEPVILPSYRLSGLSNPHLPLQAVTKASLAACSDARPEDLTYTPRAFLTDKGKFDVGFEFSMPCRHKSGVMMQVV